MNKKIKKFLIASCSVLPLVGCTKTSTYVAGTIMDNPKDGLTTVQRNNNRALVLGSSVWKRFYDEENNVVYNYYPFQDETSKVCSVWHYTSMFSMITRLLKENPESKDLKNKLDTLADGFAYYHEKRTDYRAYAINRGYAPDSVMSALDSNVYDDNEWITREFIRAYEITNDEKYLTLAKETAAYCMSGWDKTLDGDGHEWGGIFQGPSVLSKNTCSNAPVVAPWIRLYEITKDNQYLDFAKRCYDFSYTHFRLADGVYGDLIGTTRDEYENTTSQGTVNNDRYTYNSGTMISGGAELYRITKEQHYLDEAKQTAEAAFNYYASDSLVEGVYQFPVATTLWFNLQLFQGFYHLYVQDKTTSKYLDAVQKAADFAYNNYLYEDSLPVNWVAGWMYGVDKDAYKDVMDEDANAETFALLEEYAQLKAE